ncbi:hypothetical protein [Amycolatopsis sp. NPDC054798]
MSLFAALFGLAAVLFAVAGGLYLRTGFARRCAPFPITVLAVCAAWDSVEILGFLERYQFDYLLQPGFLVIESLLLYLCFAHRARHYPRISARGLAAYAITVFAISCLVILAASRLLHDPRGLLTMALAASLLPTLVLASRREGRLRPGQSPAATALFTAATAMIAAAVVADPPSDPPPPILSSVFYAFWLLVSIWYTCASWAARRAHVGEPVSS